MLIKITLVNIYWVSSYSSFRMVISVHHHLFRERSRSVLSNTVGISYMWLLSPYNLARATEELNFSFCFISFKIFKWKQCKIFFH